MSQLFGGEPPLHFKFQAAFGFFGVLNLNAGANGGQPERVIRVLYGLLASRALVNGFQAALLRCVVVGKD